MRIVALILALISAFFVFYTARLLVVTGGLQHLRAGGGGAYVGVAVFPLIAVGSGWLARRLWRRGGGSGHSTA